MLTRNNPSCKSPQLLCLQSFAASLFPLLHSFLPSTLCFQWFAASFAKYRGWGIPNASTGHPGSGAGPSSASRHTNHGPRGTNVGVALRSFCPTSLSALCVSVPARPPGGPLRQIRVLNERSEPKELFSLTPFRMNTCENTSKQSTLTPFGINTCAKTGGRGSSARRAPRSPKPSRAPSLLDPATPPPYNGKFTVTHFFDLMNASHSPAGARWAALFYAPNRHTRMQ
jgi:hypothetical protein